MTIATFITLSRSCLLLAHTTLFLYRSVWTRSANIYKTASHPDDDPSALSAAPHVPKHKKVLERAAREKEKAMPGGELSSPPYCLLAACVLLSGLCLACLLFVSSRPTLHPTPYTLHPIPYTLYPTPYTLHPTPYTLYRTTLHPTPYTLHPTPHTLH